MLIISFSKALHDRVFLLNSSSTSLYCFSFSSTTDLIVFLFPSKDSFSSFKVFITVSKTSLSLLYCESSLSSTLNLSSNTPRFPTLKSSPKAFISSSLALMFSSKFKILVLSLVIFISISLS